MCIEEILSIVCICISSVIYSYSLQLKNKKKILLVQLISNVLYGGSYIFALLINENAKIGAITVGFEILRLVVYYLIDKKENHSKIINLLASSFFCVALTVTTVLIEPNWLCLLVLMGAIPVSFALANRNILFIKIACVIQAVGITIYLILLGLIVNAILQFYVLVMGVVGLILYLVKLNKDKGVDKVVQG